MASKMFYTLQEASQRLGVEEQAVKDLVGDGKLQQFRDRDQLMFKRDEVEALATGVDEESSAGDSGAIPLADEEEAAVEQPKLSPDDTSLTGEGVEEGSEGSGADAISLADEPDTPGGEDSAEASDAGHGTGVSVFDADEVEPADPTAQTQVNRPSIGEEEALENVGSGSGLLDLTRESDDTSLGAAELLDEIGETAGQSEGSSAGALGSGVGSSGVLEATQASSESGPDLEAMGSGTQMEMDQPADVVSGAVASTYTYAEPYDPTGSGFAVGMLLGATVTLVIGLVLAMGAILRVTTPVAEQITASQNSLLLWGGGLLAGSFVLGIIGLLVGKAAGGQPGTTG